MLQIENLEKEFIMQDVYKRQGDYPRIPTGVPFLAALFVGGKYPFLHPGRRRVRRRHRSGDDGLYQTVPLPLCHGCDSAHCRNRHLGGYADQFPEKEGAGMTDLTDALGGRFPLPRETSLQHFHNHFYFTTAILHQNKNVCQA